MRRHLPVLLGSVAVLLALLALTWLLIPSQDVPFIYTFF